MRTIDIIRESYVPESFDYTKLDALATIQAPTIFVGFGGGGTNTVSMIHELFHKTFAPKLPVGAGSIPQGYQFLAFDSDITTRPRNLVMGTEWHQLQGAGLANGVWEDFRRQEEYRGWLATDVEYSEFATGCQGFRNLGRFLFNLNVTQVYQALRHAVVRATSTPALSNNQLNVYLFCTLAGGTGSGCLLDFAFLLREYYPAAKVRAILACAEGFADDESINERAKAGTYAALREIDHFMSEGRRAEWIDRLNETRPPGYLGNSRSNRGVFRFPESNIRGKYDKPFDHCFLLGHQNAPGVTLANQSRMLSAFTARVAFSLTAYPQPPMQGEVGGGQTFAANVNNIEQNLATVKRGASLRYMVPGLVSLHTPAAEVFDLITIQCATRLLRDLLAGSYHEDHRDEARDFLARRQLTRDSARAFLSAKLERLLAFDSHLVKANETTLGTRRRYEPAQRNKLFKPFRQAFAIGNLKRYVADLEETLWKEELAADEIEHDDSGARITPFTVAESLADFRRSLIEACNQELTTPNRRRLAVEDLVNDLLILLDEETRDARKALADAEAAYERERRIWSKGLSGRDSIEDLLDDVTTRSGITDVDYFKAANLKKDYVRQAGAAHKALFGRTLAALVLNYFESLKAAAEEVSGDISHYFHECYSAERELARYEDVLTKTLYEQEIGKGTSLDTVFSFNLMGVEWRDRYVRSERLLEAGRVQNLIDAHHDKLRGEARKRGDRADLRWRPLDVISRHASEDSNPDRQPLHLFVAQDLCEVIYPYFNSAYRRFTEWQDGRGMKNAMEFGSDPAGAVSPMKQWAQYLAQKCSPMWDISQNRTALRQEVSELKFLAGPPKLTDALAKEGELGNVNRSMTYESQRVTMLTFNYPIGLAGCPSVYTPLRSTHDLLMEREEKDAPTRELRAGVRRKWSCYRESWDWHDPTDLAAGDNELLEDFVGAIVVGKLFEHRGLEAEWRTFFDEALRMFRESVDGAPKQKSFGAFIQGRRVYLTPFTGIDLSAKSLDKDFEAPRQLGANPASAFDKFGKQDPAQDEARRWWDWFEKEHPRIFTPEEHAAFLLSVEDDLKKLRKSASAKSEESLLLKRMHEMVGSMLRGVSP